MSMCSHDNLQHVLDRGFACARRNWESFASARHYADERLLVLGDKELPLVDYYTVRSNSNTKYFFRAVADTTVQSDGLFTNKSAERIIAFAAKPQT